MAAVQRILSNGGLRFTASELGQGPLVLFLHGFPDTAATFAAQAPAIAAAGFRAISVAMRGYEPQSASPREHLFVADIVTDVYAWIRQLGETRAHLVGHDWGATIAYAAAAAYPESIASLAVMAVPHPGGFATELMKSPAQLQRSQYIMAFQQPEAEALITANDFAYLEALWRTWSPTWTIPDADIAAMKQAFRAPGVTSAALNWYRNSFDQVSEKGAASVALVVAPCPRPVLGLYGENDGCIGAEIFEAAMTEPLHPEGASIRKIAGAGHFLHREAPDAVNSAFIDWLSSVR